MKGMVLKPPFMGFAFAAWWGCSFSFELMHFSSATMCSMVLINGWKLNWKEKKNKETKKEKSLSYGYKSFPMICYSLLKQFSTFLHAKKG